MNKLLGLFVLVLVLNTFAISQTIIADSCKGSIIYFEENDLNEDKHISVSIFKNLCDSIYNYDRNYYEVVVSSILTQKLQILKGFIFLYDRIPSRNIIIVEDVNFDENKDLIILNNDQGMYKSFFSVYLFNAQEKNIQFNAKLSSIFIGEWEIDATNKTLFTTYEVGYHMYEYNKYEFINGDYVEIKNAN